MINGLPPIPQATGIIYGLTDPRDGIVRYVGQTVTPASRLTAHPSTDGGRAERSAARFAGRIGFRSSPALEPFWMRSASTDPRD